MAWVLPNLGSLLPNGPLDCGTANGVVAELETLLADARAARDAQQAVVNQRQSAFNTARNVWLAALAAVAATSFWNPVAMALAWVAVAMASAALVVTQARLIAEQVKLAELHARVGALEAALATAIAMRDSLCGSPTDSGGDGGSGPGVISPPNGGGDLVIG